MKKQILLFAFFFVAASAALAQQSKTSIGIKAGMTSSSIEGDVSNSLDDILAVTDGMLTTRNQTGFFAGAQVAIPVSNKISIVPGIQYAQKGYVLQGNLDLKGVEFLGANAKAQLQTQYIDIPVLVRGDFNGFQIFAGPQVSYLSRADLKTTAGVLGINLLNKKFDVTEQFNQWDAGLTGGIGYQFPNGFNISASYDHGLTKIDKNRNMDSYNRTFKVGLGFNF